MTRTPRGDTPLRGAPLSLSPADKLKSRAERQPASGRGGSHLPQLLLEVAELIAQPGGQLEVQVGCRLVHLDGELLDEVGKIGGGHLGQAPAGHSDVCLLYT